MDEKTGTLRRQAEALFTEAVGAADPGPATSRKLAQMRGEIDAVDGIVLLALGKGAVAMAKAALPIIGEKLKRGVIVTTEMAAEAVAGCEVIAAGHPVPDEGSLRGGQALADAAGGAQKGDLVLVLVSGGGSALAVAPIGGLALEDKIALNRALLKSGADIVEMNALRAAASRLKGGGLARLAHPARIISLILSDVPGDDPAVVASGPTAIGGTNGDAYGRAAEKVSKAGFPKQILAKLAPAGEAAMQDDIDVDNHIVGSNAISLDAVADAARRGGWEAVILDRWLEGDVQTAAERFLAEARKLEDEDGRFAILAGGEPSVTVTGNGLGGRNQELALRVAKLAHDRPLARSWCFLSGGTDGRDGPTDAAGGIVDAATWVRIVDGGNDPDALLADNASNAALAASGDLLVTGPTGTNVADIQILLLD